MSLSQNKRLIHITTPIGKDAFVAIKLIGEEFINSLFVFESVLLSDNHELAQEDIVGKTVTIALFNSGPDNPRYIHGYVNQLTLLDITDEGLRNYSINVVPGLWFSQLVGNNRVFHNKSAKEILQAVFAEYASVLNTKFKLSASYLAREYCVQFDETDFAFISRLMAEEGINYYFEHEKGKHTLVLCDNNQGFFDCESEPVQYNSEQNNLRKNTINKWKRKVSSHCGGYEFSDYCEFTPTSSNKVQIKTNDALNNCSSYLLRKYGLNHFAGDGNKHKFQDSYHKQLNKCAMEFIESGFDMAEGKGDCTLFTAGGRFTLDHPLSTEQGSYLITRNKLFAEDGNGVDTKCYNDFTCIPREAQPRPDPAAFQKRIPYSQIAKVLEVKATVSDSSDDLFTQVKVKFPWNSEQNSCWMRVMQQFAGKKWGANFVPRVGQEVVVSYINGDPDRPLITGAVYNGSNTGPNYTATQSGWKTKYESSQFNELRFDDKQGSEEIYMEAGKDHNWLVHNDQSGTVENDKTISVGNNHDETIGKNQTISVGKDLTATITDNMTEKVGKDQTINIGKDQTVSISKNQTITVSKNLSETVSENMSEQVGKNYSIDVGKELNINVGASQDHSIAKDLTENIGGKHSHTVSKEYVANAKKIQFVADDEIVLKTGSASIQLKKSGDITIKGKKITIKGSGDVVIKGSKIAEN